MSNVMWLECYYCGKEGFADAKALLDHHEKCPHAMDLLDNRSFIAVVRFAR